MFAVSDGARVCYDVSGEGETVILLSGFGAGRGYWRRMVPLLEGYRVVTLDNRGVGDTEYSGEFSIADQADDVVAVLDELCTERAHVVGWSMGSHIARKLAGRHPDRVGGLVLVGTYLERPARSDYVLRGMTDMVLEGRAPIECLYRSINAFCMTEATFRRFEEEGREAPLPREDMEPRGLMLQMDAIGDNDSQEPDLGISSPTLLIHGDEDIMVPWQQGRLVADRIPGSGWLLLKGQGHSIPFDAYADAVRGFLSEHPLRSLGDDVLPGRFDLRRYVGLDDAGARPLVVHVGDERHYVGVRIDEREVDAAHEHRDRVGEVVADLGAVPPYRAPVVLPQERARIRLPEQEATVACADEILRHEDGEGYPRGRRHPVDLLRPHDYVGLVTAPPAHLAGEVPPVRHADVIGEVQVVLHLGTDASEPLEDVLPTVDCHHIAPTKDAKPTRNPMTPRTIPTPLTVRHSLDLSDSTSLATPIE